MGFTDGMVTLAVLLGIFIIIYSKVKDIALTETLEEIKDMLNPVDIEQGIIP